MKITDISKISARKLNESLAKTFGKKIDFSTFDLPKLEDARNKLRTQIHQVRSESGFNENMESDAYLEAQWMLDAINAELAEREELLATGGTAEVSTEEGSGDAPINQMSDEDLADYLGVSVEEVQADRQGAEEMAMDKNMDAEGIENEGNWSYDFDDPRSGSKGAVMKRNTPVYDKLVVAVDQAHPELKTFLDLAKYYGDDLMDVIKQLEAEAKSNNASKSRGAADRLKAAMKRLSAEKTEESVEQGEEMTRITEGEIQQASAIVTAKTMVDRISRFIEELSSMENETLLQLGDSIRDEIGQEQAKSFIEASAPSIQQALETLKGTRDQLSQSVNTLATGEAPADMLGAEPGADMEAPAPEAGAEMGGEEMAAEPAGDEFAAAEPAAGGIEAAGREQRESINYQNNLLKVLAG